MAARPVQGTSTIPAPRLKRSRDAPDQAQKLADVLAEFAERLIQGFDIQEILDHLVLRIVDVLPVTGAGVMLMGSFDELHFAAASDTTILEIESLQNELGEGPCLDAYRLGQPVSIPDLSVDERFPRFSHRARERGLAAVFTFPLSISGRRSGALDLYRDVSGDLDAPAMATAQVLANVAAAYIQHARDRAEAADNLSKLRQQSLHDPLTGLPNRTLLKERLEQGLERAGRSEKLVAVLFVDLDRFKTVNDDYGHHVGDQVLIAIGNRITGILRSSDTVARLSGDEFVVICEDLGGTDDAEQIANKISAVVTEELFIEGRSLQVTASIGVAFCGAEASLPETLLRDADAAMYQAKSKGGAGHRFVDRHAGRGVDGRAELLEDLREAVESEHFQLSYQPIVSVRSGTLEGVEALLRWHHPKRGWVTPDNMLPVAESSGLILPLGEWVLSRACRDFQEWQQQYGPLVPYVTVNVSPMQVNATNFEPTISRVLESTGIDPANLYLEVTESVFLDEGPRAFTVLKQISSLGVGLILDDFGTGYSSLNYLRRFPFDVLKIDQVFTNHLNTDTQTHTIVAAVIDLAHGLDLAVVAEGVETDEQLTELARLGADSVQGYRLCRPMLVDQFDQSLLKPASRLPIRLPLPTSA